MKAYFGSRISPNITKTDEGYLICHNVPIARTGWYEYLPQEIGADGEGAIQVYRPDEEVFDQKAMSSFEGKPFTNNHPPEGVDPSNFSQYAKGHVTNVRRGKGNDDDLLLADIVANDESTLNDIVNGKREISAGYECDYEPNDDGTYTQRNIRGNHVALVDAGRAGDRVRIKDSRSVNQEMTDAEKSEYLNPDGSFKGGFDGAVKYFVSKGYSEEAAKKIAGKIAAEKGADQKPDKTKARDSKMAIKLPNRKHSRVTDLLAAVGLKHFALDAEPDEVMEAVDAMAEERNEKEEEPEKKEDDKQEGKDEDPKLAALEAKVDKCISMCEKMMQGSSKDEDPEKLIDDAIAQMENPEEVDKESQTVESNDENAPVADPEDRPQSGFKAADSAAAVAYLKAMKPAIAKIKDLAEKKMMVDAALKAVQGRPSKPSNTYQKMQKPKKTEDTKQTADPSDLGQEWMKKYNAQYKSRA